MFQSNSYNPLMLSKPYPRYQNRGQYVPRQRNLNLSPYSNLHSNKKYSYNQEVLETQGGPNKLSQGIQGRDLSLKYQKRSVTPENRRFKYTDAIDYPKDGDREYQGEVKGEVKGEHVKSIGIKRLDDMPHAARQIYARIQPRSYYDRSKERQDEVKQDTPHSRNYSKTILEKYRLQRDKETGNEKEDNENRPLSKPPICSKQEYSQKYSNPPSQIFQNDNKQASNNYRSSLNDTKTFKNKTQKYDTRIYKYRSNDPTLNRSTNILQQKQSEAEGRVRRLELPNQREYGRLERQEQYQANDISPINQLMQQLQFSNRINKQSIDFKPYHNILRQPSVLETTYTSNNTKQIRTTDHSNGQEYEQTPFSKPFPTNPSLRDEPVNQYRRREYYPQDLKQNRCFNSTKPQTFSRKLNQYQDQALNKIKTINQLNNKIGQRIKNILSSIN